jgi:non-ribosomal peptide synthetase component E (peptide arylation enzyme)
MRYSLAVALLLTLEDPNEGAFMTVGGGASGIMEILPVVKPLYRLKSKRRGAPFCSLSLQDVGICGIDGSQTLTRYTGWPGATYLDSIHFCIVFRVGANKIKGQTVAQ